MSAFNQKAPSCFVRDAYLFFLKLWPKQQSSNKLKHIQVTTGILHRGQAL